MNQPFLLPLLLASLVLGSTSHAGIRVPESRAHISFGTATRAELPRDSIRVLVWNVKKGQERGLDRDLPAYGQDRDLVLISEGLLSPKVRPIFESLTELRWDMGASFLQEQDSIAYPTGTMIGAKVPPTWVRIKHTRDLEPFIKTPKALTIARYPLQGRAEGLLVLSVHGINAVTPAAFARHMEIARAEIAAHAGPVIFAGDFNTNTSSKVSHLLGLARSLGLKTVAFRNDDRMTVLGKVIDYVFARGLQVKDAEVLGKLTSSDHKAMLIEFEAE